MTQTAPAGSIIGAPIPRAEGPDKLTGHAIYAADVTLPETLWCRILRSPHAHARIVRIDAARAMQIRGVHAVITGDDVRGRFVGKAMRDMGRGCRDAAGVLEPPSRVPARPRGYLEPHAMLLDIEVDGRVQVWAACKQPFRARAMLAQTIDVAEERIRVNAVNVGGDFGG